MKRIKKLLAATLLAATLVSTVLVGTKTNEVKAYYPAVREVLGTYYITAKTASHPAYGLIVTKEGKEYITQTVPGKSGKMVRVVLYTQESVSPEDDTLFYFKFDNSGVIYYAI